MSMFNGKLSKLNKGSTYRKTRKYIKRYTSKKARREGKKHLDDTPKRHTRGWV